MVLGVCRRLLRNSYDAEDAFQATFLVLLRKAASIRPRKNVACWLYGVAYRTALKARSLRNRRQAREKPLDPLTAPAAAQPESHEFREVIDREISRLPKKYQLAVVMCGLESRTRKEAARLLGWPEGTVATRLNKARRILARRLQHHGLTMSAARAGDKLKTPITAAFASSISVRSALIVLTDMTGLEMVSLDDAVYITTPENAAKMKAKSR